MAEKLRKRMLRDEEEKTKKDDFDQLGNTHTSFDIENQPTSPGVYIGPKIKRNKTLKFRSPTRNRKLARTSNLAVIKEES